MDHPHLKRDVPDQTQFNRILQNIDGISPKVLTQRMKTLQRLEIVERRIVLASPIHIEYRLTDLERALEPALLFAKYSMGFMPTIVFKDEKPRSFEEFLR